MSKITKYMSTKSRNVSFAKYKIPTSKIIQDSDAEKMLTLLDFGSENQNLVISISTISIILELLNLDFSKNWGWGEIM